MIYYSGNGYTTVIIILLIPEMTVSLLPVIMDTCPLLSSLSRCRYSHLQHKRLIKLFFFYSGASGVLVGHPFDTVKVGFHVFFK